MKRTLVLFVVAILVVMALPTMAARVIVRTIDHNQADSEIKPEVVYQAYWGTIDADTNFAGKAGKSAITPFAVPGILAIDPGADPIWGNFVSATAGTYTIKTVRLYKEHLGQFVQCPDIWNPDNIPLKVTQIGTDNMRTWWPLVFEPPYTLWTLEVTYYIPGNPGQLITEKWYWEVQADVDHLKALVTLFHELPFGLCEVPLISDEALFDCLIAKLDELDDAIAEQNQDAAITALRGFEDLVFAGCLSTTDCPPDAAYQNLVAGRTDVGILSLIHI